MLAHFSSPYKAGLLRPIHMKYSFMSFSTPELSLDGMLLLAKKIGYDGIEPRIDANHAHGIEISIGNAKRREIKEKALSSGIAICCLATSCNYADPEKHEQMVARTHECIDLAGDVGAPSIRVFGGRLPENVKREETVELLVKGFSTLASHAAERGVKICIETHDDWCDPQDVATVIRRVNRAFIGINWDIMHPVRVAGKTIQESFDILKPWIYHLHVHDGTTKDGKLQLVPIGTGDIDHKLAIELLKTISYDGYISGEWSGWEPYEVHLPRELKTLKDYEKGI